MGTQELETGSAQGKKDAATALYALCSGARKNRQRAVETGAMRPLLDLMADPESGMVDKAAYVLHSLGSSGEGRAAAVEEGSIPVLVEMVEVGTSRQKEIATLSLLQIGIDRDGADDGDHGVEGEDVGGVERVLFYFINRSSSIIKSNEQLSPDHICNLLACKHYFLNLIPLM
jgi:hypothetical protein